MAVTGGSVGRSLPGASSHGGKGRYSRYGSASVVVAYMNAGALELTRRTEQAPTTIPAPEKSLWLKGETSGHFQEVRDLISTATPTRSSSWSTRRSPPAIRATGAAFTGHGRTAGLRSAKRCSTRKRSTVIRNRVCEWFATCSYTGYLPFAPGTWASALTCAHPLVSSSLQ